MSPPSRRGGRERDGCTDLANSEGGVASRDGGTSATTRYSPFARAYALAASFFSTLRLTSRARMESCSSFAFTRKASRPPRRSTVFNALVEMRSLTDWPSASDIMVTLTRLAKKRRLVLMFEWLTRWPTCSPLPVNSQRRDMAENLPSFASRARARDGCTSVCDWTADV